MRNLDIPEEEFQVQYCGFELEKSMEPETLKNIKCYIIVKIVKCYIIVKIVKCYIIKIVKCYIMKKREKVSWLFVNQTITNGSCVAHDYAATSVACYWRFISWINIPVMQRGNWIRYSCQAVKKWTKTLSKDLPCELQFPTTVILKTFVIILIKHWKLSASLLYLRTDTTRVLYPIQYLLQQAPPVSYPGNDNIQKAVLCPMTILAAASIILITQSCVIQAIDNIYFKIYF